MKKCPNGFYAEIKYDGERVQVHKNGDKFEFFSRSLKNVQAHKVHNLFYSPVPMMIVVSLDRVYSRLYC